MGAGYRCSHCPPLMHNIFPRIDVKTNQLKAISGDRRAKRGVTEPPSVQDRDKGVAGRNKREQYAPRQGVIDQANQWFFTFLACIWLLEIQLNKTRHPLHPAFVVVLLDFGDNVKIKCFWVLRAERKKNLEKGVLDYLAGFQLCRRH